MSKETNKKYGVCSKCGCTENDPCWNPASGYCRWTDESHTLCSHCADPEIKNDPKTIHCINSLKKTIEKHVKWLQGPNLSRCILPLSADVGTGYEFRYANQNIRTIFRPSPTSGKRFIEFRISTYRGMSIGAVHYYCTAESAIYNEIIGLPEHHIGLFHYPKDFPEESKDMKFELARPLTEDEIKNDPERWRCYDPGDQVIAFESKEEILGIIEKLKPAFDSGWHIHIDD